MLLIGDLNNRGLAEKIGGELGVSVEYPEIHVFPDGEKRVRVKENVRGEKVLVLKSFCNSVAENILEFCFTVDAVRKTGAKEVIGIIPYLAYSRADHIFRVGEGVPLEIIINIIESAGLTKIVIFDPHSIKIPEMFSVPAETLSAVDVFIQKIKDLGFENNDLTIVSPDMGGIRRADILSEKLGKVDVVSIEKNRDLETGRVESAKVNGRINKTCFIVDDIISTGETVVKAGELLGKAGAQEIFCFATHFVSSDEASRLLAGSNLNKIFVTDSLPIPQEKKIEKLEILSIAKQIAIKIQN